MTGVEIKGMNELISTLDSFPEKIEKSLLKDALQELAEDYAKEVAASAPYDPNDRPGYYLHPEGKSFTAKKGHLNALTKGLTGKDIGSGSQFVMLPHLKFSVLPDDMNAYQGAVRKKVVANYYARFLEDGTKFIDANPWIEEEVDGMGEEMLQEFCEDLVEKILIMAAIAGGN